MGISSGMLEAKFEEVTKIRTDSGIRRSVLVVYHDDIED